MEILSKYALEIFFGLVSAGALAFCKHLWSKNKELQKLQEEDKNRQYRKMILDEIEPIIAELTRIKAELVEMENETRAKLALAETTANATHDSMYQDLYRVQEESKKQLALIINSYKFRLIQLCKTHLEDGFITTADFEQISEMYKLYHGLGGNGQAQEYYEKVKQLDVRPE